METDNKQKRGYYIIPGMYNIYIPVYIPGILYGVYVTWCQATDMFHGLPASCARVHVYIIP